MHAKSLPEPVVGQFYRGSLVTDIQEETTKVTDDRTRRRRTITFDSLMVMKEDSYTDVTPEWIIITNFGFALTIMYTSLMLAPNPTIMPEISNVIDLGYKDKFIGNSLVSNYNCWKPQLDHCKPCVEA
jgi:hypothetical protein